MRAMLMILLSLPFAVLAQKPVDTRFLRPDGVSRPTLQQTAVSSSVWRKQWRLSAFGGLGAQYGSWNQVGLGVLAAPVGLQLTRQLDTNWYAFAALSAAPTVFALNRSRQGPAFNKTYAGSSLLGANRFGGYAGAAAGIFYVNDAKTFSISGSVHMDRSSYLYPVYPIGADLRQSGNRSF